jgi:cysteinyl-tRNA synthetase
MTTQFTNTLGGQKEPFTPLDASVVRIYSCGPTIKAPAGLGKFRSFLLGDLIHRHLEYRGFTVRQVMNITDVGHLNEFEEDIIELAAARTGLYAGELVEKEVETFHADRQALGIRDCETYPHARDHIEDMIEVIRELEARGLTYTADGNLYLDVQKTRDFGKLSGQPLERLEERLQASQTKHSPAKRHPLDIDLWRTDAARTTHWKSPWGRGFPGWHVECVAMSRKYLGSSFDIHTGGHDNVFPHHDCEIAQAEALSDGTPLARYWLHSGPVLVDGQPMSVRNGNFVTVRELLESGFRGVVLRVALLSEPYREVLDFSEPLRERARECVDRILDFHTYLTDQLGTQSPAQDATDRPEWVQQTDARFDAALDDDLQYGVALSAVADGIGSLTPETLKSSEQALAALKRWDQVLGILA